MPTCVACKHDLSRCTRVCVPVPIYKMSGVYGIRNTIYCVRCAWQRGIGSMVVRQDVMEKLKGRKR